MKHNINYRLRKLSHGLSSVGIVAIMLGTTVPFSTANVSDTLNPEHVAQAAETNEDYEKTYDIVYLGDIELPFKEQEVKKSSSSTEQSNKQSDEQNKDKEIKVDIGKPYMPKEIEEKQSIEEKQNEPSLNKEDDETIIKQNESEQSPSERDSNNATEKVYDSSDVTKEQKQGQPELAETGIQKESNRLALLGIAGIGIVIAGLFFFISRKDKK